MSEKEAFKQDNDERGEGVCADMENYEDGFGREGVVQREPP